MGYQGFKELRVWQEARNLSIAVYKLTENGRFSKDYGLKEQTRKSAVSIVSNIAEGYERNSDKDFIRFLLIAKGSLAELRTQLDIAKEIAYVDRVTFEKFEGSCCMIGAMLSKLIKSRHKV